MHLLLAVALAAATWSSEILLEAEDAELEGVFVDSTRAGYSGTGYVTGFDADTDSLRFRFEAGEGVYALHLRYAAPGRFNAYEVWVDGVRQAGSLPGSQGGFTERRLVEHRLGAGTHTVVVRGNLEVDYLRLEPVVYDPPVVPPPQLSDPAATPAAQSLFAFLLEQYGRAVLSGQQELRELDFIHATTGKEPAVAGGDLIEYSPSRRQRGARPNKQTGYASSEDLIAWAGDDGIVALMWHWNAPTDFVDEAEWWRGFYTDGTTFDFAAALADPSSERYQMMLRDIDAIAVELRKFADADVPLLWRPLHEAAGGWFWWGARGPEPFKALWRLLYDRLVNLHGLHHLIWVYTHEPGAVAWYPGDDVVDIVSRDAYPSDPAALLRSDWAELQTLYGDRKLVALSETGILPDPDAYTDFGVWWSWFSMWSDWPGDGQLDYARGMDPEYLRRVFNSPRVLTRDELPDWRAYGLAAVPAVPRPAPTLALYPNPTAGPAVLRLDLPAPADVRVEVFDLLGRRVYAAALGFQPAGPLEAPVDPAIAAGVYVVRVEAGAYAAHRTLVVAR